MVSYITVLRVVAACLITNSHYTGIYPVDIIANGGLIGDILFFAISGYCLYQVKGSFVRWYSKRLLRCYLPVVLITAVYMLLGFYSLDDRGLIWWYAYPTYYHFVASIIVLYIPYYVVLNGKRLRNHIPCIMAAIFVIYVFVYAVLYDKSYYHIDNVREPMIRFLFFESMLLGAWFRQNDEKFRRKRKNITLFLAVIISFVAYFISKILFSKYRSLCDYQILNQLLIFILLYSLLRLFSALDGALERNLRGWIRKGMEYLASITLEIYVVQYVIIDLLRPHFSFPANWFLITGSILLAAGTLNCMCKRILCTCEKMQHRH